MPETFTPGKTPTVNSQASYQPRIIRVDFGNGYSLRAGDGINTIPFKGSLEFDLLDDDEYEDIKALLVARGGYEAFYYTLPGESTQKKFIAVSWDRKYGEAGLNAISIKMEEVFDIV